MKRQILILFVAVIAFASSCTPNKSMSSPDDKTFTAADSSAFCEVSISLTLPTNNDETTAKIRQHLLGVLYAQVAYGIEADSLSIAQMATKHGDDYDALVKEYSKLIADSLSADAKEIAIMNYKFDKGIDDSIVIDVPDSELAITPFNYEININRLDDGESARYAVYNNSTYSYMGGVHGGFSGSGAIIYDLKTGLPFTNYFQNGLTETVHNQIIEGLVSYFSDDIEDITKENLADYLLVPIDEVGLPVTSPYPTKDGLVFTYGQYEIAPYAAGMPSFTMPYDKIITSLTPEAKALLGLEE